MDYLNKLKSTLSTSVTNTIQNTVYHSGNIISGVIPGNPVTREYEISDHVGSAGPGLLWKIYNATKKSTKQPASVFVLERSQLEKYERQDKDIIWDLCKKGVSQLTRLRHPQILTVQHPLEESRDCIAFATEPVLASLANVLGNFENLPSPLPQQLTSFKLFDVEIKYGLLQVSEGLGFLHNSAKILHRNVSPESILINTQGAWKIAGFDYCLAGTPGSQDQLSWDCPEYDYNLPPECYPQLDYAAPEFVMLGSVTQAADMFSYGMLAYSVHNKRSLYQSNRNWGVYKKQVVDLKTIPASKLSSIPSELVDYLKLLLSPTPDLRPTPEQIQQLPYFEDVGVKTLQLLDSQFQWDNLQKSQFYKGLPSVLPKLPHRVTLHRVFPCLAKEFVNPSMVPFVLPTALQIATQTPGPDFVTYILPDLKPVMKMMDPIQILLIFMQNMELLLEKTPAEDVKTDVMPMLYRALESDVSQIQELCLKILPDFAGLLDKQSLKSALIPRIKKLCISTRLLSVRVNSLICLGKMLEFMDKWQVIDDVLPLLPQVPSKEPAVIMAIIGIIKITINSSKLGLTKEVMANKVLPFLIPLSIENGLTVQQYDSVCELLKDMMNRIESEHRTKLKQLNSLQDEQKKPFHVGLSPGQIVAAPTMQETSAMDSIYSDLGLQSYLNKDANSVADSLATPDPNQQAANKLTASKPNPSQGLSLQEKQRMLREQEALQSAAKATPRTSTVGSSQTSSSIDNSINAMMMKQSSSMQQLGTNNARQQLGAASMQQLGTNKSMAGPMSSGMPSMASSFSMSGGLNSLTLQPQQPAVSLFGGPTAGQTVTSSVMMNSSSWTQPQQTMFGNGMANRVPPAAQKPDLSAFDNLLGGPTSQQPNKQPMGAMQMTASSGGMLQPTMMGGNLMAGQTGAYGVQSQAKPLSQSDINDLLS